ncbi:UNVERIFIED_CONTAM: hypothetical protein NCL1_11913 [Trichonephila clavipes]
MINEEINVIVLAIIIVIVASEQKKTKFRPVKFRIALPSQLIDGYSSRKRKGRPAGFQAKKCVVPDDVRLANVGNHIPKMLSNCRRCVVVVANATCLT